MLVTRLARDPRVPRRRKLLLFALIAYLALPFDLVPDFIPVAGQLDDAIIVALVLRHFVRAGGEPMMRELWPGPEQSLALILRLARPGGSQPPEPPGGFDPGGFWLKVGLLPAASGYRVVRPAAPVCF